MQKNPGDIRVIVGARNFPRRDFATSRRLSRPGKSPWRKNNTGWGGIWVKLSRVLLFSSYERSHFILMARYMRLCALTLHQSRGKL